MIPNGPKCEWLALDHKLDFLLIACTDKVEVLDAGRDGKASIGTGAGVDDID